MNQEAPAIGTSATRQVRCGATGFAILAQWEAGLPGASGYSAVLLFEESLQEEPLRDGWLCRWDDR